jgi:predicted component of type VI protein secretion system
MTPKLLVRIARADSTGPREVRFFVLSPVSIGRGPSNVLRLEHPSVGRQHGAFLFTTDGALYVHHDAEAGAFIDGAAVNAGTAVPLRSDSLLQIGPFAIHLDLELHLGALPLNALSDETTDLLLRLPLGSEGGQRLGGG